MEKERHKKILDSTFKQLEEMVKENNRKKHNNRKKTAGKDRSESSEQKNS